MEWLELGFLFIVVTCVTFLSFWLVGSAYGLLRRPQVYFPFSLAFKMSLGAVVGLIFLGFGGVIAATAIFVHAFSKRQDFNVWRAIFAGAVISLFGSVALYFSLFYIAWGMLG